MNDVKRYSPMVLPITKAATMMPDQHGEFVGLDDYEALRAQLSEAQARLAEIDAAKHEIPHLYSISDDYVTCTLRVSGRFVGYIVDAEDCPDEIAQAYRDRGFAAPVSPAAQADRLCGDYPEHQEWIDDGMPCPACAAAEEKAAQVAQGVAEDVVRDAERFVALCKIALDIDSALSDAAPMLEGAATIDDMRRKLDAVVLAAQQQKAGGAE